MKSCLVTIATANTLHFAPVLMRDAASHLPEMVRVCILLSRDWRPADSLGDDFELVPVGALGLPGGENILFDYAFPELTTALQPWIIQHLFERGHDSGGLFSMCFV